MMKVLGNYHNLILIDFLDDITEGIWGTGVFSAYELGKLHKRLYPSYYYSSINQFSASILSSSMNGMHSSANSANANNTDAQQKDTNHQGKF